MLGSYIVEVTCDKLAYRKSLIIIGCSSDNLSNIRKLDEEGGANAVWTKPVQFSINILKRLEKLAAELDVVANAEYPFFEKLFKKRKI